MHTFNIYISVKMQFTPMLMANRTFRTATIRNRIFVVVHTAYKRQHEAQLKSQFSYLQF